MARIPREYLDGMAEFATGIRRWSEWQSWFVGNARQLYSMMDRHLFEQLNRNPEEGVATLLRHEEVTIRPADKWHPDQLDDPISAEEYEVYTALCRQQDLFLFDEPDTVFENQTDGNSVGDLSNRPRLVFDEAQREYRVQPELADQFPLLFREWFERHPGMFDSYKSRNQCRWPLEKRFHVENGYCLMSELGEHERDSTRGAFCLSRVGFSADGRIALAFIRYSVICSYYVVFERSTTRWERAEFSMAWIT